MRKLYGIEVGVLAFEQAVELLKERKSVESLVSFITYRLGDEGLEAEGLLVPFDSVTDEEMDGKWREVEVIASVEELRELSVHEKNELLDDALKHYVFKERK